MGRLGRVQRDPAAVLRELLKKKKCKAQNNHLSLRRSPRITTKRQYGRVCGVGWVGGWGVRFQRGRQGRRHNPVPTEE